MAYDPRKLVIRAFKMAKESGKPARMTIAVLKNRMLTLSNGQFDERNHDTHSFTEFLEDLNDLVFLDTTSSVPMVELAGEPAVLDEVDLPKGRIRRDLWNAIMDYTSEKAFVWDKKKEAAVPTNRPSSDLQLPSITQDEMKQWRLDFVDKWREDVNDEELQILLDWHVKGLTTYALPRQLQREWNVELKRLAWQRLKDWFARESIPVPDDAFGGKVQRSQTSSSSCAALRAIVIECVREMTADELAALPLPPRAVLRAKSALGKIRDK